MFCPLCGHLMVYDDTQQTYRCRKTDFHPERHVAITVGLIRFKGSILKQNEDIEKSHILLIMKETENGAHGIIKGSDITVHSKTTKLS